MDRSDGAGEEKVLFRSPSVLGAVALVPAPEGALSEIAVSAVVARVGARDLGCVWPSCDIEIECLLCENELCRDRWEERGVEKERWPLPLPLLSTLVEAGRGYGLFFETLFFFALIAPPLPTRRGLTGWLESPWMFFRLARRFIQLANGLRRACRSAIAVSHNSFGLGDASTIHLPCARAGPSVEAMIVAQGSAATAGL